MEIEEIVDWLNENYNQNSDNYSIIAGPRCGVTRLDEHTAISIWSCGAIVCDRSRLRFIHEDDGNWFIVEDREIDSDYTHTTLGEFSIDWAKHFTEAMKELVDYVETYGTTVYYSGHEGDLKYISHYTL